MSEEIEETSTPEPSILEKIGTAIKSVFLSLFGSQSRLSYRRLLVFGVGTGFCLSGLLASDEWLYLALAYIGGDSAQKAISVFRRG
jgi:hypothetical protein